MENFTNLLKPHKIGKFWKMLGHGFFLGGIFPLGNKKNGNSNPTKYIFGNNPTNFDKLTTHTKKSYFYPITSLFYNYILLSLLVEDLQPTNLRKLRRKTPQTTMPLPTNLVAVVGLYQGSFKFEKEDGLGRGRHQHFHAR